MKLKVVSQDGGPSRAERKNKGQAALTRITKFDYK